jgi:hypothetical protein
MKKAFIILLITANFFFLIYNSWLLSNTQIAYNNINELTELSTRMLNDAAFKIKISNELLAFLVDKTDENTIKVYETLDKISRIIYSDQGMFDQYAELLEEMEK